MPDAISNETLLDIHRRMVRIRVFEEKAGRQAEDGKIPGALHLPRGMLEFEIHKLVETSRPNDSTPPEEQEILLYCGTGGRSALAAETLAQLGYRNVTSLDGGIVAWAQARNWPRFISTGMPCASA